MALLKAGQRVAGGGARLALRILLALCLAWAAAAVWFDGPASRPLAGLLTAGIGAGALAVLFAPRPFRRALVAGGLVFAVVVGWWLSIPPSADRDWIADVARTPKTTRDGDRIRIENVRNFHYRSETDFDEIWETRDYDLSQLQGVDLFLITWGAPGIAHTIVSWEFADAPPLAISIETRKEKGEAYSAVLGFFRHFELYYVVADEHDVIGVRASHRGEQLRLYRVRMPLETARALLIRYLDEVDALAAVPRWYNALTHNCTTEIRWNLATIGAAGALDWRLLANTHLDAMMYERGRIDTSLPFPELRRISDITERAQAASDDPDFPRRIREGLPGMETAQEGVKRGHRAARRSADRRGGGRGVPGSRRLRRTRPALDREVSRDGADAAERDEEAAAHGRGASRRDRGAAAGEPGAAFRGDESLGGTLVRGAALVLSAALVLVRVPMAALGSGASRQERLVLGGRHVR